MTTAPLGILKDTKTELKCVALNHLHGRKLSREAHTRDGVHVLVEFVTHQSHEEIGATSEPSSTATRRSECVSSQDMCIYNNDCIGIHYAHIS